MSASAHRHSCLQLGICQDRPTCAECTRVHSSEGHQSALRIERLINSRAQHTVMQPLPEQPAPTPAAPAPQLSTALLLYALILFGALGCAHLVVRYLV